MNRTTLGLAIGAGYVLGRTKKAKLAFAVGSLVAGRRMHLSPKAIGDLVSRQLRENPQVKEIGDQLRQDLSGVGKAASGAMVERQLDSLANRLHGRTAQVRDRLADVPGTLRGEADEEPEEREEEAEAREEPEGREETTGRREKDEQGTEDEPEQRERAPERRKKAARKAPAKPAPARKGEARKKTTAVGKPAARKTSGTRRTAEGARERLPKGGGER